MNSLMASMIKVQSNLLFVGIKELYEITTYSEKHCLSEHFTFIWKKYLDEALAN